MRFLLIDDDPEIHFLVGFVLRRAGHELTGADSGSAGLDAVGDDAFDLVLLDYRLGDMSGEVVLATLRERAPALPVVFLTGKDDPETARTLLAAGAAGVIGKPFDPESLARRLETVLAARRTGGDVA